MGVLQNPKYSYLLGNQPFFYKVFKVLFYFYSKLVFSTYAPLSVFGKENIPKSSFIFCSNHCSHMDSAALMYAGGEDFDQYGMVAAKDYFFDNKSRNNFLSRLMNLIPADRGASRESIVRLMVACREFTSHRNRSIIIYPEGTRSLSGDMSTMKKGAAMIATELNLPIVPVYIDGTFRAYPKGVKIIRPTRVRIYIGEAIDPHRFAEENGGGRSIYTAITTEMESRIRKMKELHG